MNNALSNHDVGYGLLGKLSIVTWIGILILFGTYFRNRPKEIVPEEDWLIIAQVSACLFGAFLGILLMKKQTYMGFGAKTLLVYIAVTLLSAIFSPYTKLVVGYWVLLAGASLLTVGLVQQAQTQKSLNQMENVWLFTITLLLLKDMMTSLLFQEFQETSGPFRLGMGITHPNIMGFLAVLAFWMSFKKEEIKHIQLLWLPRVLLLLIILLSRSRTAIMCFVFGAVIRFWFQQVIQRKPSLNLLVVIPCSFLAIIVFGILALSFEFPGAYDVFSVLNRGLNVDSIMSFQGRTEIWYYAIKRVFDGPYLFLFGHGYGTSRFFLSEESGPISYFVSHTHNSP